MASTIRSSLIIFIVMLSALPTVAAIAAMASAGPAAPEDSGGAITGQPLRQKSVSIHCAKGQASAVTDMQGQWKVDASGLAFPCLLVIPTEQGKTLHSIAGRPGLWYVSPLTNAALLQTMPDGLLKGADRERETALPALWQRLRQSLSLIRERLAAARIPVTDEDFFEIDIPRLPQSESAEGTDRDDALGGDGGGSGALPTFAVLGGVALETIRMKMPQHPDTLALASGRLPATAAASQNRSAGSNCPAGLIWLQSASIVWPDALPANGQLLSVTLYENLFKTVDTRHGGDGKRVFRLPDLRKRAPKGFSYMVCTGVSARSPVLQ